MEPAVVMTVPTGEPADSTTRSVGKGAATSWAGVGVESMVAVSTVIGVGTSIADGPRFIVLYIAYSVSGSVSPGEFVNVITSCSSAREAAPNRTHLLITGMEILPNMAGLSSRASHILRMTPFAQQNSCWIT